MHNKGRERITIGWRLAALGINGQDDDHGWQCDRRAETAAIDEEGGYRRGWWRQAEVAAAVEDGGDKRSCSWLAVMRPIVGDGTTGGHERDHQGVATTGRGGWLRTTGVAAPGGNGRNRRGWG